MARAPRPTFAEASAADARSPCGDELCRRACLYCRGGAPISGATVTLWAATSDEPKKLIQVQTGGDGRFTMQVPTARGTDVSLYLVATGGRAAANPNSGDNPAIALMTVLGNEPPANVVINEMTTVASVWTHAQFLDATGTKPAH